MKQFDKENLIYEDNHLVVVTKPSYITTQPELTDMVKSWIKIKDKKAGAVFLHSIHRLDKVVSGIVVFAKTSKALSRLQKQMRERKIKKTYYAIVNSSPPATKQKLHHFLIHEEFCASIGREGFGKEAILEYEIINRHQSFYLLKIQLETGRYHQIRAQLSAIGCPILGDRKYGNNFDLKEGVALHHFQLCLTHPVTQLWMTFVSPPPFLFKKYGFSTSLENP